MLQRLHFASTGSAMVLWTSHERNRSIFMRNRKETLEQIPPALAKPSKPLVPVLMCYRCRLYLKKILEDFPL